MSLLTIAIIAFCVWIAVMIATWCASWRNVLSVIFVVGLAAIAVGVSWQRIEQHRARQAAVAAIQQRSAVASAVAVPPPNRARAGG